MNVKNIIEIRTHLETCMDIMNAGRSERTYEDFDPTWNKKVQYVLKTPLEEKFKLLGNMLYEVYSEADKLITEQYKIDFEKPID